MVILFVTISLEVKFQNNVSGWVAFLLRWVFLPESYIKPGE